MAGDLPIETLLRLLVLPMVYKEFALAKYLSMNSMIWTFI